MKKRPYVHAPEEGTPEADAQPWTIRVPFRVPFSVWESEEAEAQEGETLADVEIEERS